MNLEHERKKIELKRVEMARDEMLFKIMQRQSDIDTLTKNAEVQTKRMEELKEELKQGS